MKKQNFYVKLVIFRNEHQKFRLFQIIFLLNTATAVFNTASSCD